MRAVSDYLALFADELLLFEPGERFHYSNDGYILLGAIVEQASGQDYSGYVRGHIYEHARMSDTDCPELDSEHPERIAFSVTVVALQLASQQLGPRT